ncbi:MAG: S8 family serine peptidase, partial [Bacteroidota bacterium]|nr:S8 family serine peptidase [Bacteroidota bacterium]
MKKFVLLVFVIMSLNVFAQAPLNKYSNALALRMQGDKSGNYLVWVSFKDKGADFSKYLSAPQTVLSSKSIERRLKYKLPALDNSDMPVNESYIKEVSLLGGTVKQKSRWFNAISLYASKALIEKIAVLPFVDKIDVVASYAANMKTETMHSISKQNGTNTPTNTDVIDYGYSLTQLQQLNVPAVHNLGYHGEGITIAVLDAGFSLLSHEAFQNMHIIAKWDFVNHDPGVGDSTDMGEGSHGTQTLSTIGGFKSGKQVGPAYAASFILAKTENTDSETPIEEDNWIAGIEWADSIGVDVSSTSLGYITFDSPYTSHTWQDMNGNTCRITIAADLAVKKGIVVVNSAGNEGNNSSHNTLGAPADGDSVITAGAVTSSGTRSDFSSVGPTADGRTKPDIMA